MRKNDTKKNTPPLNAVRVFVAAARCLSFSRAARELGMTQSGVSHHVAGLEGHLGRRLFARRGANVEPVDDRSEPPRGGDRLEACHAGAKSSHLR